MGLSGSIPLILKEKGASYEALSLFSLVSIPFSLKLIWAPFVDCFYSISFGRRKTWLVPVQLLTGIVMIFGASFVADWLGDSTDGSTGVGSDMGDAATATDPQIGHLTAFFLFLYFLMATQDIAVDGWALTMLSRDSVGYASICNTIGQVIGVFIANQGFIALSDARWCHKYLGVNGGGLVTLPQFMQFWGYVFVVVTIFIGIFKHEEPVDPSDHPDGLLETCKQVVAILKLPAIQSIAVILLTCKMAMAPADAVFSFKLQENGMPKSDIATISPLLLMAGLLVPSFASHYVTGHAMFTFMLGVCVKICTSLGLWFMVQQTREAYHDPTGPHMSFMAPLVVLMLLHEVAGNLTFISMMAFFSRISDPTIGGSYMTLLNTIANLGHKWTSSVALLLLPRMTFHACTLDAAEGFEREKLVFPCSPHDHALCTEHGGKCTIDLDGYTLQAYVALCVGIAWVLLFWNRVKNLQALPHTDWLVATSNDKGK
eukprot:gene10456-12216_t